MVRRSVAPPRRPAVAAGQGNAPRPTNKGEPRAPAPDHLVLCPLDCARPLDQCHCLRGMLEDRKLVAIEIVDDWARPDWTPRHAPAPGVISFEPDFTPSTAPLLIALALGVTAAVSFGLAWWLA